MGHLEPMLKIVMAVFVLVMAADFVIFLRWLVHQARLQRAVRDYGLVYDEEPAEPPTAPATVRPDYDLGDAAPPATGSGPLPYAVVKPPFAKRWSLVDPFLGMQGVMLAATVLLIVPMLIGMAVLAAQGRGVAEIADPASSGMKSLVLWLTLAGLFLQNGLLAAVTAFYMRRYGTDLAGIGLYRLSDPRIRRDALLGLGLGAALIAVAFVAEVGLTAFLGRVIGPDALAALKKMGEAFDAGALFQQMDGFWPKILFLVGGAVAAPIGEEIFFRGFVYNAFKHRMGVAWAVVLSGLVFAVIHASPLSVLVIFPMGMLLAWVYERTRSLWVTIIIHAVNNGVAFLYLWYSAGWGK